MIARKSFEETGQQDEPVYESMKIDDSLPEYTDTESEYSKEFHNDWTQQEDPKKKRSREIKTDLMVLATTTLLKGVPILIDKLKHNKESGTPFKANKEQVFDLLFTTVVPTIKAIDTIVLKGKINSKVPLDDIRNITNTVSAYKPTKRAIDVLIDNINRSKNNRVVNNNDDGSAGEMVSSVINLVSPFFVGKMCDNRLKFKEKIDAMFIVPMPFIGNFVRKTLSRNSKFARTYDIAATTLRAATNATRNIGSAVRSEPGSALNKGVSTIGNILDVTSDVLGCSRGNLGGMNYSGYSNRGTNWGI